MGEICAASFKHTAPAGVALGSRALSDVEKRVFNLGALADLDINSSPAALAYYRCRHCDPLSSFGDFVAISGLVDETCAQLIKREADGIRLYGQAKILKLKKG